MVNLTIGSVIVLALSLASSRLKHYILVGIDRLYYRDTYYHRQTLQNFSNKMGNILNLEELANEILPAITKALHVSNARLLFQDIGSGDFTTQFVYPGTNMLDITKEFKIYFDNPVVSWLNKHNTALEVNRIYSISELKNLSQSEREQIIQLDIELFCPITGGGKLIGILALSKKINGKSFNFEDIELIRKMFNQAGTIIENAQAYMQAAQLANTDSLTGLYNHRGFHEHLEQEIARGSRFGSVFSLVMMDLDLFKSYNDTCGHLAGDEALRNIGKIIQKSIRSADLAFRYGGDEFAIILPETRLDDGYQLAERIRKEVESRMQALVVPITMSLGVASWPLDGVMKEEIIARADAALYMVKQNGRNKTCLSTKVLKTEMPSLEAEIENKKRALSIVYALAATVDAKDHYTFGHSNKVSDYAVSIAEAMNFPPNLISAIRAAGLLHDVGKVGIPDSILKKKERLTASDWDYIKEHPRIGVEILRNVADLSPCLPAVLHHHERFDGTGYPSGLKGKEIPLEARILTVVDAFEAITSERPYRSQLSLSEGLAELQRCSGTQFDPEVVNIFCKIMLSASVEQKKSIEV